MESITSVEYMPIRHLITFIAYEMNWSIVRVAEWLLARDYEKYATAYKKGEDSKFYEINNIAEPLDIATRYLLKQTLNIGHGALCSEGESEENKYFYKAYYKIADINNHHILDKLDLNFNKIYDFNYSTDANGYVKAMDNSLIDNVKNAADTDSVEQLLADAKLEIKKLEQAQSSGTSMMGKPSATSCDPKTDKERVIELEQELAAVKAKLKIYVEMPIDDKELAPNSQAKVACMLYAILKENNYDLSPPMGKGLSNDLIVTASKTHKTPVTRNFVSNWLKRAYQLDIDTNK